MNEFIAVRLLWWIIGTVLGGAVAILFLARMRWVSLRLRIVESAVPGNPWPLALGFFAAGGITILCFVSMFLAILFPLIGDNP